MGESSFSGAGVKGGAQRGATAAAVPGPLVNVAQPRRERTRQALTEAATTLIAEKGVAGLRIQEITERAEVALGSFYNHFATKDELVAAVVASTIEVHAGAIVDAMSRLEDPAEIVAFACQRMVRLASNEPELARLFVNLDRADAMFETIVHRSAFAALQAGSASGRFDISDPTAALVMIIGGALAVMRAVLDGRCGAGSDDFFAESVLRSVGLDRGEAVRAARRVHGQ